MYEEFLGVNLDQSLFVPKYITWPEVCGALYWAETDPFEYLTLRKEDRVSQNVELFVKVKA